MSGLMTALVLLCGQASQPNILYLMADDLGFADLGCYGHAFNETPNIDKLAKEGMRFRFAYTCGPNCQPTRAALMSGQYGPRTGIYTVGNINRFDWQSRPLRPVENVEQLPSGKTTLAQAMKSAGYATGHFGKWHLGNQGEFHPTKRGFDESIVSQGKHFEFKTVPPVDYPKGAYLADWLTDKAVDFIQRKKDKPFFLCLHHFGVHSPFEAKPNLIRKFQMKKATLPHHDPVYAAMLYSVDESVGEILALLDELKLRDNTLVIFASDNGGVGGYAREGIRGAPDKTDNAPLRGGKGMLYEGGIRIPYICNWPGKIRPGSESSTPICSVDLFPTLLDVAGAKKTAAQILDGESFLPVIQGDGGTPLKRTDIFWHFPGYLGAGENSYRTTPVSVVRSNNWKLLEFLETGKLELYDVVADVGEKMDQSARRPEVVRDLKVKLDTWRKGIGAPMPGKNIPRANQGKKKKQD